LNYQLTYENQKMKINLLAFGIAKEVLGKNSIEYQLEDKATVGILKKSLMERYPAFSDLASLKIAVNEAYAQDDREIHENDEVVIIPPVSGG